MALYDLVGLVDLSFSDESSKKEFKEDDELLKQPQPKAGAINKYLTYADAIPEKVCAAIIKTIKMCLNGRPSL